MTCGGRASRRHGRLVNACPAVGDSHGLHWRGLRFGLALLGLLAGQGEALGIVLAEELG